MSSSVTLKLVLPDKTLRRITVAGDVSFESFQVLAKRIAGVDPVFLAFQDEDGDFITVASSTELSEFLNAGTTAAATTTTKVKKLFISAHPLAQESPATAAAQEAAQESDPVDERSPLERLASALSKPETVRELQKALGESPVVVDAVTGVANAFLTSGLGGALAAGRDQIPLVVAVAEEAAARDPELDAAVKDLRRQHDDTENGHGHAGEWFHHPMAFLGPLMGAWHGFGGGGHHHPCGGGGAAASAAAAAPTAAHNNNNRPVHAFVVCDGCDNDADLKARARAAGTISMRDWILGERFKSQTVPDFDLCETCHATGRFVAYGPFDNVPPRFGRGGRGGCGGGGFRCGGPGRHAAQQQQQQQQRGCRGSRKNAFAEVLAETIKSVSEAVVESANEDSEVAQIARAVRDSLLSANAKSQQQQQTAAPAKPASVPAATPVPVAAPAQQAASPAATASTEDPVDATWEHVDPMVKWSAQLQKLHALGFTDVEAYIPMLEDEKGDLEKVVNRIIRRNA